MPYRDARDALRARNEALERAVAELRSLLAGQRPRARRWPLRALPPILVLGLLTAAPLLLSSSTPAAVPDASPAAEPTSEPPLAALAALEVHSDAPKPPAAHVSSTDTRLGSYRGTVTRASGRTPVRADDTCTASVQLDGASCVLRVWCGDWYMNRGLSACSIDEHDLPSAKEPPAVGHARLRLVGGRLELGDDRPGREYATEMRLEAMPAK